MRFLRSSSALREAPYNRFCKWCRDAPLTDPIIDLFGAAHAEDWADCATKPGYHFAACKNILACAAPSESCLSERNDSTSSEHAVFTFAKGDMRASRLGLQCLLWVNASFDVRQRLPVYPHNRTSKSR